MKEESENCLPTLLIILDTGILGLLTNPKCSKAQLRCKNWFRKITENKQIEITTSEICDYELRRELIRCKKHEGLKRLNEFRDTFGCLEVTRDVLDKAAQLWAWARETNQATAHDESIDADVILSAQSIILSSEYNKSSIIATTNTKHLDRYTPSLHWEEATIENCIKRCQK
ncbi:nuclease [Floridanema evergladense]|uniref:Nuclease n=1 Tax=Floridaenema evergladense BLCC-F167 TaxID=3153639 RepID=A0ABV4WKJ6_9CYAN